MIINNLGREYHYFNEADDTNKPATTPGAPQPAAAPGADDDAEDYTADAQDTDDDEDADYTTGADDAGDGSDPDDGGDNDQTIDVNVNVNDDGSGDPAATDATGDDGGADYTAGTDNADGEEGTDEENADGEEGGDEAEADEFGDGGDVDPDGARATIYNDLKDVEGQLFGDLTPEQQAFKHKELLSLFHGLYKSVDKAVLRVNDIPKTDMNVKVIELVAKVLVELKEMLHLNITESYWTRTYFENEMLYQQCLAQYNYVIRMLEQIVPEEKNNEDDIEDAEKFQDKLDIASDSAANEPNEVDMSGLSGEGSLREV